MALGLHERVLVNGKVKVEAFGDMVKVGRRAKMWKVQRKMCSSFFRLVIDSASSYLGADI